MKLSAREIVLMIIIILLLVSVSIMFKSPEKTVQEEDSSYGIKEVQQVVPAKVHTVKKGEFLNWIADKYGVQTEQIMLTNETFLKQQYDEICGRLSTRYRNRSGRSGLFCNDRFKNPWGNTLMKGNRLTIPAVFSSQETEDIVKVFSGKSMALVIDDTGSMQDGYDRRLVGDVYSAAMQKQSVALTGIWLYADGQVRSYKKGNVEYFMDGSTENTHEALIAASKDNPESIVLITDEPGDDWDWNAVKKLPKVIAHCLPDGDSYLCEENLMRLARETGGRYIEGRM